MTQPAEYEAPKRGEQINEGENQHTDYPAETDTQPEQLFEPDWDHDNPIPVYIVTTPQVPQIVEWSSTRITVQDQPVEIMGAKKNRVRAVLQNEGSGAIFIGPDMSVSTALAYKLNVAANYTITMKHNGAVWARCAAGDTAVINVIQEYTVDLDDNV